MTLEQVISFAKQQEYETAEYLDEWRGYDVYEPIHDTEETTYTGLPYVILVKGDEIRMSTEEETFQYMDEMEVDEDDEEA